MVLGTVTATKWWRVAVVMGTTVILQIGILNGIVIDGAHPDSFLLMAIAAGLVAGPQDGAVIAFSIGIVADLFVLTPYGLSSLCFVIVAFGTGLLAGLPGGRAPNGFRMLTAVVASAVGTLLFALLETLIGQPAIPRHQLAVVVAVVSIFNALLAIPAVAGMSWALNPGLASRDLASLSGGSAAR